MFISLHDRSGRILDPRWCDPNLLPDRLQLSERQSTAARQRIGRSVLDSALQDLADVSVRESTLVDGGLGHRPPHSDECALQSVERNRQTQRYEPLASQASRFWSEEHVKRAMLRWHAGQADLMTTAPLRSYG
jgi:hypothetical protein